MEIPFNKPYMTGNELTFIAEAHANGHLAGDGKFSKRCQSWLTQQTSSKNVLLTHSCTAALEMSAILAGIQPGDEIIMPSFTFVSTANAFVLRGGIPVFVDIRSDTQNIDESLIENAITDKTKAIVPVHYAGVSCEMDTIMSIAKKHNLIVIEDTAQGIMSSYKGKPLGSFGQMATLSFHETKNIISGEGGALLINDMQLNERAEIIREKGTDRSKFFRGEVDKYSWVDIGSSYLPSELIAAFLWAQIEQAENITNRRLKIWQKYHDAFEIKEAEGIIHRPVIPKDCKHNAHMYYLKLPTLEMRNEFIDLLKKQDIHPVFHYIPLHTSASGMTYGHTVGTLSITQEVSDRIVRLPLWLGIEPNQDQIIENMLQTLNKLTN